MLDSPESVLYADCMSNHQQWLEAPYDRQARMDAAFEAWCEQEGWDLDDEEAFDNFERYCDDWSE